MKHYQGYITFSVLLGIAYAIFGLYGLDVYAEHVVLALAIIVIAAILPDIDSNDAGPSHEVGALLAAITPIVVLQYFPGLEAGGMARIALVVIACYLVTRVFIVRVLRQFTVHRGMVHSIPAAIITFEVAFLLFHDLYWIDRLYIAGAAFLGFFSHLLLDASSGFDIVGKAMGNEKRQRPVLKFFSPSWATNLAVYAGVFVLGWFVMRDFYPALSLETTLHY